MKKESSFTTTISIYSRHPLAQMTIERALAADTSLRITQTMSAEGENSDCDPGGVRITILDGCWGTNDVALISRMARQSSVIVLLPEDGASITEQMRLLYLGINGIVVVTTQFDRVLSRAVHSVVQGELWVRRNILEEYVSQTNATLRGIDRVCATFTGREKQIVAFMLRGMSNRQMSSLLSISERTIKFHVSNILQKSNMKSRQCLLAAISSVQCHGSSANHLAAFTV